MSPQEPHLPDDLSLPTEFRRYFTDHGVWPSGLHLLAEDVVRLPSGGDPSPSLALECEEHETLLELVVEEETRGINVAQRYPALWQHVTTCPDCHELYQWLKGDMAQLTQQPSPIIAAAPRIIPPKVADPWIPQERTWQEGKRLRVAYKLHRVDLQKSLRAAHPHALRGVAPSAQHLLLTDEFASSHDHLVQVDVTAQRTLARPESVLIRAAVVSQGSLPDNIRVTLSWGTLTRSAQLDEAGVAYFDAIPLDSLLGEGEAGEEFGIAFEG